MLSWSEALSKHWRVDWWLLTFECVCATVCCVWSFVYNADWLCGCKWLSSPQGWQGTVTMETQRNSQWWVDPQPADEGAQQLRVCCIKFLSGFKFKRVRLWSYHSTLTCCHLQPGAFTDYRSYENDAESSDGLRWQNACSMKVWSSRPVVVLFCDVQVTERV